MNVKNRKISALIPCLFALSLAPDLVAQSVQPAIQKTADDQPVTLNPFEVRAGSDKGFVAADSLAGGRLAGDLKDTPVAYSVITREFIDALQLTDWTQMSQWATNSTPEVNQPGLLQFGNGASAYSRGLSSDNMQKDFFPVYGGIGFTVNLDSYNIERMDLARGPNAVLFGASGVGGTQNVVSKQAQTNRAFADVRGSFGSWENRRVTLDYNQPVSDKAALRVNLLDQARNGWQTGDAENRKGATLAGIWKPTKNTEIRATAARDEGSRAVVTPWFGDGISGWDGVTTFKAPIASGSNPQGIVVQGLRTSVYTPSNGGQLLNYQGWAATEGGNAAATVPAGGMLVAGPTANISLQPITQQLNLPGSLYNTAVAGSNFRIPSRSAFTARDGKTYSYASDDFTLAVTQRVADNFFLEVAGNYRRQDSLIDLGNAGGINRLFLDVNAVLPNGQVNSNFLQPYIQAQYQPFTINLNTLSGRAALGYVLNNTRLGNYSFNVIAGDVHQSMDLNARTYVLKNNADPRQWPTYNPVIFRYYTNTDASRPLYAPASWTYVDPAGAGTSTVPAGLVANYGRTSFNNITKSDFKNIQAAGSAKLFDNRVDLLAAVRRDEYTVRQGAIVSQFDNPTNWDGYTRYLKPSAPSDWQNLTYRVLDANGNPVGAVLPAATRPRINGVADPRYANVRFQDDYSPRDVVGTSDTFTYGSVIHITKNIGIFGNYAEGFNPPRAGQTGINGSIFQPQASKGTDYGLRFTLLDGGVVANFTRYTGSQNNQAVSNALGGNINTIISAPPLTDLNPGDLNQRGVPLLPAGYIDTSNVKTSGYEFELTANITRSWRMMFNAARPHGCPVMSS